MLQWGEIAEACALTPHRSLSLHSLAWICCIGILTVSKATFCSAQVIDAL